MLRHAVLMILAASPLRAQGTVSDAFGILPAAALSPERAAWAGLRSGDAPQTVAPAPADTVLLFIGPKSLVAGAEDGHAVALAVDRHGNLVADGQAAEFVLGPARLAGATTRNGVADVLFRPAPQAGVLEGGATVGGRQSTRVLFSVTADLHSVSPDIVPAGPMRVETMATLSTGPLHDQFGNSVEDGVALPLIIRHDDCAYSLATAAAMDGRAEFDLLVRGMDTGGQGRAFVGDNGSAEAMIALDAPALTAPTPARVWPLADVEAVGLRIGPVATSAGHLLNDGAPVSARVTAAAGQVADASGWLRDGYFEAVLPLPPEAGPFVIDLVTALGAERALAALSERPTRLREAE